jgi:hypothetical protein
LGEKGSKAFGAVGSTLPRDERDPLKRTRVALQGTFRTAPHGAFFPFKNQPARPLPKSGKVLK